MAHCPDGKHTMVEVPAQGAAVARRACTACGFAPCPELEHDWEVHPYHVQMHPPQYEKICVRCRERRIWAPAGKTAAVGDRGTVASHYDRHAKAAGHPPARGFSLPAKLAAFVAGLLPKGKGGA